MGFLDAFRGNDKLHFVAVFGRLLLDGVDQLQGPVRILALVERGLDPDREELGA
jgi:hypothetical protein